MPKMNAIDAKMPLPIYWLLSLYTYSTHLSALTHSITRTYFINLRGPLAIGKSAFMCGHLALA
jgi:hypothetical protein